MTRLVRDQLEASEARLAYKKHWQARDKLERSVLWKRANTYTKKTAVYLFQEKSVV